MVYDGKRQPLILSDQDWNIVGPNLRITLPLQWKGATQDDVAGMYGMVAQTLMDMAQIMQRKALLVGRTPDREGLRTHLFQCRSELHQKYQLLKSDCHYLGLDIKEGRTPDAQKQKESAHSFTERHAKAETEFTDSAPVVPLRRFRK